MAKKTPKQIADKWLRNIKASGTDMREGIMNVTEAPGIAAAAAEDKLVARWNESITSGKWANNVKSVSLQDWQQAMLKKGVGRVAAGADEALTGVESFHVQREQHQDGIDSQLANMPKVTLEDSMARIRVQIEGMAKFVHDKSR